MSAGFVLRDYQVAAVDAVEATWNKGVRRTAVVAATGAGKTIMISELARRVREKGGRVALACHREELIQQAAGKLTAFGLRPGIVASGRDQYKADLVVASVATLARPGRAERIGQRDVLIWDECHHATASSWMDVHDRIKPSFLAGFTATLIRTDGDPLSGAFDSVAYVKDIGSLIKEGHLCDVRAYQVKIENLDLGKVRKTGGDFSGASLTQALLESDATVETLKVWSEHASDRSTVVFTPTVELAHVFAAKFKEIGVTAAAVSGKTPAAERAEILRAYNAGEIQVVANAMILTEGWDAPRTGCVVIARPTASRGLFVQMAGRGLRPFPGKPDVVILDVVGNAGKGMRLATFADLAGHEVRDGEKIMEAEERLDEERERARRDRGPLLGQYLIKAEEVDLFGQGVGGHGLIAWKSSPVYGIKYVSTRNALWFVWPDGFGNYRAGVRRTGAGSRDDGLWTIPNGWVGEAGSLEHAVAQVEIHATDEDPYLAKRSSSWFSGSRSKTQPSDAQLKFARGLGIEIPEGASKVEVSDLIDVARSGGWLDQRAALMTQRMAQELTQ